MGFSPLTATPADGSDRARTRGQSLVEFALLLPVFLLLFAAALDLGRLAYARIAVENAAREAALQASVTPTSYTAGLPCPAPDPLTGDPPTNLVICRALLEADGSPIEIAPTDVSLTCDPNCSSGIGHTITIEVRGSMPLLTPFMAAFFGGSVGFSSTATAQIETLPTAGDAPDPTSTPDPTGEPSPSPTPEPTVEPTPTPTPACTLPSAGFTYTTAPSTGKSPVTMTVTDTSSASAWCPITSWAWDWGDGVTTYGQSQLPHVYYNPGPVANKSFSVTLTVTNAVGSSTSGAVIITVKKK